LLTLPATLLKALIPKSRDQIKADREAEFKAAEEAIKLRYEKEAEAEGADVRAYQKLAIKNLKNWHQMLKL
jgi:hypothetical protein